MKGDARNRNGSTSSRLILLITLSMCLLLCAWNFGIALKLDFPLYSKDDITTSPPIIRHENQITKADEVGLTKTDEVGPFRKFLTKFDWDAKTFPEEQWKTFFIGLTEFLYQEPLVPINQSCKASELLPPKDIDCNLYPKARFNSSSPSSIDIPKKVGHAIQLGFDVDVVEIHLNELYDVVDKFFIIEWTESHNAQLNPKKLTWEHVKYQPRFVKFHDKVVHLILDDTDTVQMDGGMWSRETYQERKRWEKIQLWNERTKFFQPHDIIGFGDADEVASRHNVHLLKYCTMTTASLDIGIWFPFGHIDYAFPSGWQVSGHPYTLGDPSFWTFASAAKAKKYPNRMRGKSGAFLLSGMHLTHYGYLPYQITKRLIGSESLNHYPWVKDMISKALQVNNSLAAMDAEMSLPWEASRHKWKKISKVPPSQLKGIVYHPWFYDCNRDRYPRWEGKPDSRLGLLD
jgi:hypothetical protein